MVRGPAFAANNLAIKSIQTVSSSITSGTTDDNTITAVDTANTIIIGKQRTILTPM